MIRRLLLAIIVLVAAPPVCGGGAAALAHAVLVETVPADGAVLDAPPGTVVIRFSEPVTPIAVRVLDGAGRAVTAPEAATARDREVRIALPPDLPRGSYIASYRVTSLDSHPIGGSIVFAVGAPSATGPTARAGEVDDAGWRAALLAARLVLYAGLLGGAGGVLCRLLVRPPAADGAGTPGRATAGLATAGAVAALLSIGLEGGLLTGAPAAGLADPAVWRVGYAATLGRSATAAALGLLLVAAAAAMGRRRGAAAVAAAGAALALSSLAMSGHAVTAGPAWITVPAVLAHVACVAFWIGSLWPLRRAIGERGAAAAPAVRRFSLIAVPAVLVLAGAGVVIAALQVRTPGALVDTGYGRLLLAKLALVAGLLLLAALNKLRLTPALARGEARAATALRRSIAAETGLAAAILVATGLLGTTPPPRALAGHAAADHAATAHGASGHAGHHAHHAGGAAGPVVERASVADPAGREATIEVAPAGREGAAVVAVALARPDGTPLRPIEVTVSLSNHAAGIEPISRGAAETGPGAYRVDGLVLAPGPWTVRVEALVDDFEKAVFEATVEIR